MRHILLTLAALSTSLSAAPLLDCNFACALPGASNQSVCAPVAAAMHIAVDHTNTATINYDAWNGTIWRTLVVHFDDLTAFSHAVNIHSNGGEATLYLGSMANIVGMSAILEGLFEPGRLTTFTADCAGGCGATPEPSTASLALLAVVLMGGVGRYANRRRWWPR